MCYIITMWNKKIFKIVKILGLTNLFSLFFHNKVREKIFQIFSKVVPNETQNNCKQQLAKERWWKVYFSFTKPNLFLKGEMIFCLQFGTSYCTLKLDAVDYSAILKSFQYVILKPSVLYIYRCIYPPIYSSIYPLSIYLSLYLSIYLSTIYLYILYLSRMFPLLYLQPSIYEPSH